MSEQGARRLMSSNSLKLVAGGVSLLALASAGGAGFGLLLQWSGAHFFPIGPGC